MTSSEKFYGKTRRVFLNQETINLHLYCSVCLDIFEEPQRLSCGHTFCYICIQNCVKSQHKRICPECKSDFSRRKLEKDFLAAKMVDDLEVKCMHNGCKFVCKNSIVKKHQRLCQYRQKKDCNIDVKVFEIDEQGQQIEILQTLPVRPTDKKQTNLIESSQSQSQSSQQIRQIRQAVR